MRIFTFFHMLYNMEANEENNPVVNLRLGSSLVKYKPLLSTDSKCLFCCCGHVVRVVSTSTGQCIRELRGHTDVVTSVKTNPKNLLQVFTASLDHTIRQWDYTDGVVLKVYHVQFAVHGLLVPGFDDGNVLAIRQFKEKRYDLVRVALPRTDSSTVKPTVVLQPVSYKEKHISMGLKNQFLASISEKKLTVAHLDKKENYEHWLGVDRSKQFTCVACHPTEMCIATGCSDGVIFLWFNFMGGKKVVKTINHWHALPVGDLAFTAEGSYLLSGGHECVLVKWQLNSQYKDFLPRLGAPINHLVCSSDNSVYVTCHTDNALHLVANSLKLLQVIQGLNRGHRDSRSPNPLPAGLLFDNRSKALVLNGKPGHLQFYSMYSDRQLFNLDIVCQNYISSENIKRPLVVTEVENAAFSNDGAWLATVERREDGVTSMESRLKFWAFDSTTQTYTLNTSVDMPHGDTVNSISFRPISNQIQDEAPMLVTSSEDGKFKLWLLVDDTDIYRSNKCWMCESVGYYRDVPAGCAAFSGDGSILAVAFGSALTLWDPDTNALKTTLRRGEEKLKHVIFGSGQSSHMLMTATNEKLTAWNLLSCTVSWTLSLSVAVLVADGFSEHMAGFTNDSELIVFKPSSPDAVYKHQAASKSSILAAIFIPNQSPKLKSSNTNDPLAWQDQSQLYFMNSRQELLTIARESDIKTTDVITVEQSLPDTPFSLLMAEKRKKEIKEATRQEAVTGQPGMLAVKELLGTPAHVLPPASALCGTFIKSLLITSKTENRMNVDDDEDSIADDSKDSEDSDSDMETGEVVSHVDTNIKPINKKMVITEPIAKEDFSFLCSKVL